MKLETIDWEQDLPLDAKEVYKSLVRALKRTDGFSLLFVRCSPVQGDCIISDIRSEKELSTKRVEVLELNGTINNLYDKVFDFLKLDRINSLATYIPIDVLFIKGLEYSIYAYEDREMNDINRRSQSSVYGGKWKGVPRVLGNLNLSRERFRNDFKFCFVFLLPEFAIRYFIRRAPDFFDWRSNIYEFSTDKEIVNKEVHRLAFSGRLGSDYRDLSTSQRITKLSEVLSYLGEENLEPENQAALWIEKGLIHIAGKEYEEAIVSYDNALQIQPNEYIKVTKNIGEFIVSSSRITLNTGTSTIVIILALVILLGSSGLGVYIGFLSGNLTIYTILGCLTGFLVDGVLIKIILDNTRPHIPKVSSFDPSVEITFGKHKAWNNRGFALANLGRYEEAISSYDKALQINPDYFQALLNRGDALKALGRHEESIDSYNQVLTINPDSSEAYDGISDAIHNIQSYTDML